MGGCERPLNTGMRSSVLLLILIVFSLALTGCQRGLPSPNVPMEEGALIPGQPGMDDFCRRHPEQEGKMCL